MCLHCTQYKLGSNFSSIIYFKQHTNFFFKTLWKLIKILLNGQNSRLQQWLQQLLHSRYETFPDQYFHFPGVSNKFGNKNQSPFLSKHYFFKEELEPKIMQTENLHNLWY